jgi:hypothetical protein
MCSLNFDFSLTSCQAADKVDTTADLMLPHTVVFASPPVDNLQRAQATWYYSACASASTALAGYAAGSTLVRVPATLCRPLTLLEAFTRTERVFTPLTSLHAADSVAASDSALAAFYRSWGAPDPTPSAEGPPGSATAPSSMAHLPSALSAPLRPFAPPSRTFAAAVAAYALSASTDPLTRALATRLSGSRNVRENDDDGSDNGARAGDTSGWTAATGDGSFVGSSSAALELACVHAGVSSALAREFARSNGSVGAGGGGAVPWVASTSEELPCAFFIRGPPIAPLCLGAGSAGADSGADIDGGAGVKDPASSDEDAFASPGRAPLSAAAATAIATLLSWPEVKPLTPTELAWLLCVAAPMLAPGALAPDTAEAGTAAGADGGDAFAGAGNSSRPAGSPRAGPCRLPFAFTVQQALVPDLTNPAAAAALLPAPLFAPPPPQGPHSHGRPPPLTPRFPSAAAWRRARTLQLRAAAAHALLSAPLRRTTVRRRCLLLPDATYASADAELITAAASTVVVASSVTAFQLSVSPSGFAARRARALPAFSAALEAVHTRAAHDRARQLRFGSGGEAARAAFDGEQRRRLAAGRGATIAALAGLTPRVFSLAGPALAAVVPYTELLSTYVNVSTDDSAAAAPLRLRDVLAYSTTESAAASATAATSGRRGSATSAATDQPAEALGRWADALGGAMHGHWNGKQCPLPPLAAGTVSQWATGLPPPPQAAAMTLRLLSTAAAAAAAGDAVPGKRGQSLLSPHGSDGCLVAVKALTPRRLGALEWRADARPQPRLLPALHGKSGAARSVTCARALGAVPWEASTGDSQFASTADAGVVGDRNEAAAAADGAATADAADAFAARLGLAQLDLFTQAVGGYTWLGWACVATVPAAAPTALPFFSAARAAAAAAPVTAVCGERCLECGRCRARADAVSGGADSASAVGALLVAAAVASVCEPRAHAPHGSAGGQTSQQQTDTAPPPEKPPISAAAAAAAAAVAATAAAQGEDARYERMRTLTRRVSKLDARTAELAGVFSATFGATDAADVVGTKGTSPAAAKGTTDPGVRRVRTAGLPSARGGLTVTAAGTASLWPDAARTGPGYFAVRLAARARERVARAEDATRHSAAVEQRMLARGRERAEERAAGWAARTLASARETVVKRPQTARLAAAPAVPPIPPPPLPPRDEADLPRYYSQLRAWQAALAAAGVALPPELAAFADSLLAPTPTPAPATAPVLAGPVMLATGYSEAGSVWGGGGADTSAHSPERTPAWTPKPVDAAGPGHGVHSTGPRVRRLASTSGGAGVRLSGAVSASASVASLGAASASSAAGAGASTGAGEDADIWSLGAPSRSSSRARLWTPVDKAHAGATRDGGSSKSKPRVYVLARGAGAPDV